jgi:hypothetical protein|tara:strand:- start:20097 stop:21359 length:1263 start_codon:yes stop_codon:yes gene_type:complete
MITFYGIVEDRNDPLMVGRVRVRIHGIHSENKQYIATPDLPWAQVLLPTTSAGLSGIGTQHGLVEGSTVYGFFRDGETRQDPVITHVSAGIPQNGYKETTKDELLTRNIEKGFNDPRRLKVDDYKDTPDGPNPEQAPNRSHGLTSSIETAPKTPKELKINYDNTGSTIEELEVTADMLPYYPLYTEESDLSSIARGGILDHAINGGMVHPVTQKILGDFVDVQAKPVYPYNKVLQTEAGHVLEIDDTPKAERLNVHHRSGTFHEIHADGSEVTRIVNNNYTAILKDDKVYIAGNADLQVGHGNVNITINTGNVDMKVLKGNVSSEITEGNLKADILKGTTDVLSEGKITITGNNTTEIISDTTVTGTLHVTGAQTNDSTIHAKGDISTDAGDSPTLATHKHDTTITGGSSSGKYTSVKGK